MQRCILHSASHAVPAQWQYAVPAPAHQAAAALHQPALRQHGVQLHLVAHRLDARPAGQVLHLRLIGRAHMAAVVGWRDGIAACTPDVNNSSQHSSSGWCGDFEGWHSSAYAQCHQSPAPSTAAVPTGPRPHLRQAEIADADVARQPLVHQRLHGGPAAGWSAAQQAVLLAAPGGEEAPARRRPTARPDDMVGFWGSATVPTPPHQVCRSVTPSSGSWVPGFQASGPARLGRGTIAEMASRPGSMPCCCCSMCCMGCGHCRGPHTFKPLLHSNPLPDLQCSRHTSSWPQPKSASDCSTDRLQRSIEFDG